MYVWLTITRLYLNNLKYLNPSVDRSVKNLGRLEKKHKIAKLYELQ